MAYKITHALIKGTWDGTPGSSNFTQDPAVFATVEEFFSDYASDQDMVDVLNEYLASGDITQRARALSVDGKVKINTTEFIDEAAHDAFVGDPRIDAENVLTKCFSVEEAPTPGDVNTFNGDIYYHSAAHLF